LTVDAHLCGQKQRENRSVHELEKMGADGPARTNIKNEPKGPKYKGRKWKGAEGKEAGRIWKKKDK